MSLDADLRSGADSLGVALSDQQLRKLLDYLALLAKWNRVYNLTAVRDERQMLVQHLLDSLAVV
ncbi:MAG: 16S rRNA (guanine(527)-N(7))-methyltransferase RsmG, partial [Burkholderiales bacterium]